MVTNKLKKIEAYKKEIETLEKQVAAQRRNELLALPGKFGHGSLREFIRALRSAARGAGKAGGRKKGRKKRAKITPELKQKVKAAVGAGKTGAQIAAKFGISLPSVHNIKKELGLVKKRG